MKQLNPEWEKRKKTEIDEILTKAPYDDMAEG